MAQVRKARSRADSGAAPTRAEGTATLRLAIGRGGLGFDLGTAAKVSCIDVTELTVSLPTAKFPIDVSGGVHRFRHKRGALERLTIEIPQKRLAKLAAQKLRGIVGTKPPEVAIAYRPFGATVGILDDEDGRALAFDVAVMVDEDAIVLTIVNARGIRLREPAVTLAMAAVAAMLGRAASQRGAIFTVQGAAAHVVCAVLPDAGARAPSADGIRWTQLGGTADCFVLQAGRGASAAPDAFSVRAHEAAMLCADADDARFAKDLSRARALDLFALERAPRHAEICRRIADLDRTVGGRAFAARSTLMDAESSISSQSLSAELAEDAGDRSAAHASWVHAAESEPLPAFAALEFERAAALADMIDALRLLDLAVVRAPSLRRVRWARLERRLMAGRLRDATADAEELEALASGIGAKYAVWKRAGEIWHRAGLSSESRLLFERALRFKPDDAIAMAGLGAALLSQGSIARGASLLSRAIDIGESSGRGGAFGRWKLALARALAETMNDRPAAIARARTIESDEPEALLARGLEGRWRADLGDTASAKLCFAEVRDLAMLRGDTDKESRSEWLKALLLEAAKFETRAGDFASAQAHLATALRLRPQDNDLAIAYRNACAQTTPGALSEMGEPSTTSTPGTPSPRHSLAPATELDAGVEEAARAEELLRAYQANPQNDEIVEELATSLQRLGRSHELLALLNARLEDAPPDRREKLMPLQIAVLARLEHEARVRGHDREAQLFRDALGALGGTILP